MESTFKKRKLEQDGNDAKQKKCGNDVKKVLKKIQVWNMWWKNLIKCKINFLQPGWETNIAQLNKELKISQRGGGVTGG